MPQLNARNSFIVVTSVWLYLLSSLVFSQSVPDFSPIPSWVQNETPNDKAEIIQKEVVGGVAYLLVDAQIKVEENASQHYFYHFADYIINQTGVENNSQINVSFDPIYEEVQLHQLVVWRDGNIIDKSASSNIQVFQRETDLDNLIYNGLYTVSIIVDDVRVGDIVEYSYSIVGANPVYKDYFAYSHRLQWGVPVEDVSLRVLWNKKTSLAHKVLNTNSEVTQKTTKNGTEYLIRAKQSPAIVTEKGSPNWHSPWGRVYFSELSSWSEVANWGLTLYEGAFKSNAEIDNIVDDIRSKSTDPKEQISMALRFVQDEIRYLGIELGQNSHIPSPANETMDRRYGDCKDKSVLLITMLEKLGIPADPVLVNTRLQKGLFDRPISPRAFNHVIVSVPLADQTLFLDPTRTYQYGQLDSIYQPDFGAALILTPDTDSLTTMTNASHDASIVINERFNLTSDPRELVSSTTETTFAGRNAERERAYLNDTGLKDTQRDFLDFFSRFYGETEVRKDMEIRDDESANKLTVTEHYGIKQLWEANEKVDGRFDTTFYANIVDSYIDFRKEAKREDPLQISHPTDVSQRIEIQLPDHNWRFDDERFSKINDHFEFRFSSKFDKENNLLTLFFSFKTVSDLVDASDFQKYKEDLETVSDYLSYGIYWIPNASPVTPQSEFQLTPANAMGIYFLLLIVAILLWRWDRKRNPEPNQGEYYPVKLPKLITMWIITFGIYGAYWFYKNFKYVKSIENKPSMPMARGIFSYFWYFPLWESLQKNSVAKFGENQLPGRNIAILLAILFLATAFAGRADLLAVPGIILGSLLVLPMANYILHINGENEATLYNSKWGFRHYYLTILCVPILLFTFSSEIGVTPSEKVIKGEKLLSFDIRKFQQKGVVSSDEEIRYFYSAGIFSNQEDGNGFTQSNVFSFWEGDNGSFNLEKAAFEDIKNIKPNYSKDMFSDSSVTIERYNGTEFILYVSNIEKKDKLFVDELMRQWELKK